MPFTYKYQRPALTVDCVVFRKDKKELQVLLIQRDKYPFQGQWALPGGFVDMDERLEQAAMRELKEETGLTGIKLTQLHTFDAVDRDPRHRTVSVAFYGVAVADKSNVKAASDARDARWFPVKQLPHLAFDHNDMVDKARKLIE